MDRLLFAGEGDSLPLYHAQPNRLVLAQGYIRCGLGDAEFLAQTSLSRFEDLKQRRVANRDRISTIGERNAQVCDLPQARFGQCLRAEAQLLLEAGHLMRGPGGDGPDFTLGQADDPPDLFSSLRSGAARWGGRPNSRRSAAERPFAGFTMWAPSAHVKGSLIQSSVGKADSSATVCIS